MSDMTIQNAIHCMKAMICEAVCEECDYYGKTGTDHCEADAVRMAIKALEEQPHWIPCSERLPSEGDTVLLYENYAYSIGRLFKTATGEYEWSVNGWYTKIDDWSVWMPLPKPYGGESE